MVAGEAAALVRRRSPWREDGESERVTVGSHPTRADVLISGLGILSEHVRLYLPRSGGKPADLLVIQPGSTKVSGRSVDPREWVQLLGGEGLGLGPWRFRYEYDCEEATG